MLRLGTRDGRAFLDSCRVVRTEVDDETIVVRDILYVAGNDLDAELLHILRRLVDHLIREAVTVRIDGFQRQRADDLAHVALKGILQILRDLFPREVQEVPCCKLHALLVASDHDLGDSIDIHIDVIVRRHGCLRLDVHRNLPEKKRVHALKERDARSAPPDEDARALLDAGNNECRRRRSLHIAAC